MVNVPKVSVITAFYNRASSVRRTLHSIINQTIIEDAEIIVFDDFSSDETADEIQKVASEMAPKNFRVLRPEKNLGMTLGFKRAVRQARGQYIAIQGAGDASAPSRLELQAKILDDRPEVCLVGCYYRNIVEELSSYRVRKPVADDMDLKSLQRGNVFSHGEVMFRKSAYFEVGEYREEFRFAQDYDLWLRLISVGKFYTVKEVLYDRYVQFDGVSYNVDKFPLQARYAIFARRIADMSPHDCEEIIGQLNNDFVLDYIPLGDPELQRYFLKSILTMAIWGNPSGARLASKNLIVDPGRRMALQAVSLLLDGPAKPLLRLITDHATGMRKL